MSTPEPPRTADVPGRAGARQWWGLALLALPLFVLSLDVSVLFLAAPHLTADLAPSGTQLLWIMDIYAFMIAGFLVTMGTLGDRIGRRRLLLIGAAAFTAASVVAAFAPTPEALIAARALLGVAGATLMPSTLALIRTMFLDERQRGLAIAVWMTVFSAGIALGPVIGGALLESFWWGSVFLLAVPIMVAVLVVGPVLLPEARGSEHGRLDPLSVLLSLATVLAVIWGLKQLAEYGWTVASVGAVVVGLALGTVFVRRQGRLEAPLVDIGLFREGRFTAALLLLLLGITAINGINFLVPQFLQLVEDLSPLEAGLMMIPLALAAIVGSMLAPALASRFGASGVIAVGASVSAVGFLMITQVTAATGPVLLIGAAVVAMLGLSPLGVLATGIVLGTAPADKAGSAASMSETSGEFGVGLGVAAMGSVTAAVYSSALAPGLPAGLPEQAADDAMQNLAGAIEVAATLPAELGIALTTAAKDAFADGVNVAGVSGAVLAVGLAVVAVMLRRHITPAQADEVGAAAEAELTRVEQ